MLTKNSHQGKEGRNFLERLLMTQTKIVLGYFPSWRTLMPRLKSRYLCWRKIPQISLLRGLKTRPSHLASLPSHKHILRNWAETTPFEYGNYRPISVLQSMSKVLEKIVDSQVRSYLNYRDILYSKQFGFRGLWGCDQSLLLFTDFAKSKKNSKIWRFWRLFWI